MGDLSKTVWGCICSTVTELTLAVYALFLRLS